MLVLPADQPIDPDARRLPRRPARRRRPTSPTGAFDIEGPLVTLGIQVDRPGDRLRLPHPRRRPRRASRRPARLSARARSRRSRSRPAPRTWPKDAGVAWNAGIFLWRRRAIRAALEPLHRPAPVARPDGRQPGDARAAYEAIQRRSRSTTRSWRARPRAARSSWPRWMSAGPTSGRGRRCSRRSGRAASGAVVQAGETVEVDDDDLVVRRIGGRLGRHRATRARVAMTAAQPIAVLRGAGPDRALVAGAPRALLRTGGLT